MKNDADNITTEKLMTHNNPGILITFQNKEIFHFQQLFQF